MCDIPFCIDCKGFYGKTWRKETAKVHGSIMGEWILKGTEWKGENWTHLVHDGKALEDCCEYSNGACWFHKVGNFLTSWGTVSFPGWTLLNGVSYIISLMIRDNKLQVNCHKWHKQNKSQCCETIMASRNTAWLCEWTLL